MVGFGKQLRNADGNQNCAVFLQVQLIIIQVYNQVSYLARLWFKKQVFYISYLFTAAGFHVPAGNIRLSIYNLESTAMKFFQAVGYFFFCCHNFSVL